MLDSPARALQLQGAEAVLHELQVHQIELELQNEELRRTQQDLSEARARYFDLYDLAPMGLCSTDEHGLIREANVGLGHVLGRSSASLCGQKLEQFICDGDQETYHRYRLELGLPESEQGCELRLRLEDGSMRWIQLQAVAMLDARGQPQLRLALMDIDQRKRDEADRVLAASMFDHAGEGILVTSAQGEIVAVNQAFTRITGYEAAEVLGRNPRLLSSGRHGPDFFAHMWSQLQRDGSVQLEIWNRHKSGKLFAVTQTISAVRGTGGVIQNYVGLFSDITHLQEQEVRLQRLTHYDPLTQLPNRLLLAERLQRSMAQAQIQGCLLAVVFLDLDGFKAVNDSHGHEVGDQLLIAVAEAMKLTLREGDALARLGGDEFVAVLSDLATVAEAQPLLQQLLAASALPLIVAGQTLQVSASLGVTFFPQDEEMDADQLLRQADQAMYQAKLAGKNRMHLFDAQHDRSLRGHHESVQRIAQALAAGEFVLYFQPKVDMVAGHVVGAEALIRWQHPQRGLLPPAVFLPVIEDHALAIELGEWVIDQALRQLAAWQSEGQVLPVSVNIGARQLQQADFVERLQRLLARHAELAPGLLELEVLETSAIEDITHVTRLIAECKALGVRFALDDFGTGYSSLTYLKRLPVAQLKIDQSFVRDMLDNPVDISILQGVIGMARAFGCEVIAEGVETVAHGTVLIQLGCRLAQGYGIAKPMPASDLPAWMAEWRPDASWLTAALPAG
ncbi:EAL domain-containing protein [Paucibacter sp. DJ1R-11]|uniref:sensor domain-containing protein n=1 Tax=Paucibacter sp. DJ1R-11 TaxID=2893556 RepID=UPI0021E3B6DD|nr:bifunctional diguanylate cyclase/phosphodiesterase [Paucibacter sp. DJ1R-11]MCV2362350.1 EAL domain-containing protein [Paucibacter sp. DJ1R-11]